MKFSRITTTLGVTIALASAASAQTAWPNVNLPSTFQPITGTLTENFDTIAGVVPTWMATTAIDAVTGLPDVEAWANLGQTAPCLSPFSGAYSLEMGLAPIYTSFHDVQNALVMGLNGAGAADTILSFMAHNGGEETDVFDGVWVSDDGVNWYSAGANPWSTVVPSGNKWTFVNNIDISLTAASVAGDFYLMIAQDDNFPFVGAGTGASDGIGIDDISVGNAGTTPPPPPPPAVTWSHVNLPTSFTSIQGGFTEDFEAAAGVLSANMATTMVDAVTLLPDVDGWANIGQLGAFTIVPASGTYFLEMSLAPTYGTTHDVQNALVLGLNGGGSSSYGLDFGLYEALDELDAFDGVWLSDDGSTWYRLHDGMGLTSSWATVSMPDISYTGANITGDFYLMFAQDDNFPITSDGICFDDIVITAGAPVLDIPGPCPGPTSLDVTGLAPFSPTVFVWGVTQGAFPIPGGVICGGTSLDILSPIIFTILVSDASGVIALPLNMPAVACGLVHVQALDLGTCLKTNVVSL